MVGNEPGPDGEWAERIALLRETSGMVECGCGRYFDRRRAGQRRCGVCRREGRN